MARGIHRSHPPWQSQGAGSPVGSQHTDERIANRDLLKTLWGSTLRDVQESARQRSKRRYHERGMTRGVMDDLVAGSK